MDIGERKIIGIYDLRIVEADFSSKACETLMIKFLMINLSVT